MFLVQTMSLFLPDRVFQDIRRFAKKHGIQQVILFGSRARGTHSAKSDIDLAVSGGNAMQFYDDLEENAHTLLRFDVVNLSGIVSAALRENIEKDGVLLYAETGEF